LTNVVTPVHSIVKLLPDLLKIGAPRAIIFVAVVLGPCLVEEEA